ncbi:MAG: hypothetical protein IPL61_19615 [Myxococcales bacterium]|nr:hypothetical protein [Myxococcales bacterium]
MVIAGSAAGVSMPADRDTRTGRWFFKTTVRLPDGTRRRISGRPGVTGPFQDLSPTKIGATEAERRAITAALGGSWPGQPVEREEEPPCPMFSEFAEGHYLPKMRAIGNKRVNKPATINAKESHLRHHLLPRFGGKRLDEIDEVGVEDLKLGLAKAGRSAKTINNVLTTLRNILVNARKRKAHRSGARDRVVADLDAEVRLLRLRGMRAPGRGCSEGGRLVDRRARRGEDRPPAWRAAGTEVGRTSILSPARSTSV